jgi:DNA-binding MarR family transcriptional regulator
MRDQVDTAQSRAEEDRRWDAAHQLTHTFDLNWLLHRAAQRLRCAQGRVAAALGVNLRGYLVLTALAQEPARTQLALGASLGLDKTTLMTTLDRLEQDGLLVRRQHPTDRRVRIPELTERGRTVQRRVAEATAQVEGEIAKVLSEAELKALRTALSRLANAPVDGLATQTGSCI